MSSRMMNSQASLRPLLQKGIVIAPGVHDGLSARQAVRAGAEAVYMTGFGVAGSLLGVPDIGVVSATEMMERVRALVPAAAPERMVQAYEQAGAAAIQLEDQVLPKRCGHMDGKELVGREEAVARIRTAVAARTSIDFLVIARTDARSVKGMDEALWRADAFLAAGADILFVEAPQGIEELQQIGNHFRGVPLMANMVEDGKTPRLAPKDLERLGYRLVIYPVSAILAAAATYANVYRHVLAGQEIPGDQRVTFQDYNALMGLEAYRKRD